MFVYIVVYKYTKRKVIFMNGGKKKTRAREKESFSMEMAVDCMLACFLFLVFDMFLGLRLGRLHFLLFLS